MEMIELQLEIFCLIVIGFFLAKKGMLSASTRKQLTTIVLNLVLPCSILCSFELDMTLEILMRCISVLIASIFIQILYALVIKVAWKKVEDPKKKVVLDYATMVSNAGFMGMPIAEAAFGSQGLLYASIFLIPQRVCMWSLGLSLFAGQSSAKETIKKVITHPCIVALFLGVCFMLAGFAGFHLPGFIDSTIHAIASCNTALCMIVIGAILSDVPFAEMKNQTALLYSALRLIGLPFIILLGCRIFQFGSLAAAICILESAMPAPSTVVMLAENYQGDTKMASILVFVSTMLSLFTLPLWLLFLSGMV